MPRPISYAVFCLKKKTGVAFLLAGWRPVNASGPRCADVLADAGVRSAVAARTTRRVASRALGSCMADRDARAFFFNDPATTEIYTLSLHDALPIWSVPSTS